MTIIRAYYFISSSCVGRIRPIIVAEDSYLFLADSEIG
jgi:hypothetical protein